MKFMKQQLVWYHESVSQVISTTVRKKRNLPPLATLSKRDRSLADADFLLMALLLLSVISLKAIYLTALFLLLLMVQLLPPFQSLVVFPRALSFPLHFFCSSSMTFSALPLPLFMLLQMIQLCTFPPALIPLVLLLTALNPKLPWLQLLTLILRVFPSGVTKI